MHDVHVCRTRHQLRLLSVGNSRIIRTESCVSAFSCCRSVKHVIVPEPPSPPLLIEAVHQLFSTSPRVNHFLVLISHSMINSLQDRWPNYIGQYVRYTMKLTNPHRVSLLLEIMRELVAKGILPSKSASCV